MNYNDTPSEEKDKNNKQIIKFVRTYLGSCLGSVLVLDAERLGFTELVLDTLDPHYIILPQLDVDTYSLMMKKKRRICPQKCLIYPHSLELVLHGLYDYNRPLFNDINVAYFDYTGNIEGNKAKDLYPLEDIDFFLHNTPQKDLILALTDTGERKELWKDQPPKTSLGYNEINFLIPAFHYRRWRVVNCWKRQYKREGEKSMTMDFYLYYLTFDPSVDTDVEFMLNPDGKFAGYRDDKRERVFMRKREMILTDPRNKFNSRETLY